MKKKYKIILAPLIIICLIAGAFLVYQCNRNATLSNENASSEAKALYDYIISIEGEYVLSGQQESTWMGSPNYETDYILSCSGQLPVIKGFDYMNDDYDGVNSRAIAWYEKGGIVTICHHCGSDFTGEWTDCKEDDVSDWEAMLTEGTDSYNKMIEAMDKDAIALKELCDMGIPVLWRPFHEFDGDWFWWSRGGSEAFKKMWQIMYQRYTEYWELDNLIWVLGYSHKMLELRDWYPGDDYCDIIGADTYDISLNRKLYRAMKSVTLDPKPLCLHECGDNPTVIDLKKRPWSFFMTWHTEYLTDTNSPQELAELYNSDIVLTLEEVNIQ